SWCCCRRWPLGWRWALGCRATCARWRCWSRRCRPWSPRPRCRSRTGWRRGWRRPWWATGSCWRWPRCRPGGSCWTGSGAEAIRTEGAAWAASGRGRTSTEVDCRVAAEAAPARGPGLSGPEKRNRPRRSGACVETRRWRRSEAVLGRHAVQVGAAVERADDAAAAGGDVHARVVRLQVAEGEVDVELVADRPGGADRVPATVVVGQARG